MTNNRRDFLRQTAMASLGVPALAGLGASDGRALAQAVEALAAQGQTSDEDTFKFWTEEVRGASTQVSERRVKSVGDLKEVRLASARSGNPATRPVFALYTKDGFVNASASELPDKDLPKKGDVDVVLRVTAFRPSKADRERFANLKTGSLRIDLQQVAPMPGIPEALAWTAAAALLPDQKGKLPELQSLQFNPGTTWGRLNKVPLTGGLGFWTWNFFMQKEAGAWGRFVRMFHRAAEVVFPLLTLPAIAVTALKSVDTFLGFIQAKDNTEWLFKSEDVPVYGTLEAKEALPGPKMQLRTGDYVIVPQMLAGSLQQSGLELQQGLIVPKGTPSLGIYEAALNTLPDVSYLSVSVAASQKSASK